MTVRDLFGGIEMMDEAGAYNWTVEEILQRLVLQCEAQPILVAQPRSPRRLGRTAFVSQISK